MQSSVTSKSNTCFHCGAMVYSGMGHTCAPHVAVQWANPLPTVLYSVQACPVCEGRGNMPHGFYSRATVASNLEPETCHTCDGKGILKVGIGGAVEKVS